MLLCDPKPELKLMPMLLREYGAHLPACVLHGLLVVATCSSPPSCESFGGINNCFAVALVKHWSAVQKRGLFITLSLPFHKTQHFSWLVLGWAKCWHFAEEFGGNCLCPAQSSDIWKMLGPCYICTAGEVIQLSSCLETSPTHKFFVWVGTQCLGTMQVLPRTSLVK